MLVKVQLFTTLGCHLCEQAEAMFNYMLEHEKEIDKQFTLQLVEISTQQALIEEYGIRIPVLKCGKSELDWPFEYEELIDWISKL